ncbi:hypothetical protein VTI74DRAFT_2483 [Chaetomium olivicolor]
MNKKSRSIIRCLATELRACPWSRFSEQLAMVFSHFSFSEQRSFSKHITFLQRGTKAKSPASNLGLTGSICSCGRSAKRIESTANCVVLNTTVTT